ncbi:MAG TPA: glycosyltransferase family 39 protein [Acidimicrobiales bacterium]|nr:glycosyltransferase family 39 protein [Acidimicrobiales bacterium]
MTRKPLVLVVATAVFCGLALRGAWADGPTYDEATDLTSALTALTRHDLRATPQHPPLFRELAAAPLLAWHPYIPAGAAWARGSGHDLAARFMRHEARHGHLRRDLFVARLVPVAEAAAVAWLLAMAGEELFGGAAGLLAALLWLANPFVVGLGHVDGIDGPATLTTVLAALAVLRARRAPTGRAVVLVGLCGGLAILARLTGLIVVSTAAVGVAAAAWPSDRRLAVARAAAIVAVAWATVGVAYALLSPVDVVPAHLGVVGLATSLGHLALPPAWLRGTRHLLRVGNEPGPAFVLGRAHTGRWPWFWPASLVVKWPPTTLLVLAALPLTWARLPRQTRREAAWVVALPAAALTLFTVQQQRPIGLRYLLPVLALWLLAASPLVEVVRGAARPAVAALAVAGGLLPALAAPALAWTDPLLGPGYRTATDSNLDWGESYNALAAWTAEHPAAVVYFGPPGLGPATLPRAHALPVPPAPVTGWVVVSASRLTAYRRADLAWLRAYCPVGVLDGSALVYRFAASPDRSLVGPDRPAAACDGGVSRPVVSRRAGPRTRPGRAGPPAGRPS